MSFSSSRLRVGRCLVESGKCHLVGLSRFVALALGDGDIAPHLIGDRRVTWFGDRIHLLERIAGLARDQKKPGKAQGEHLRQLRVLDLGLAGLEQLHRFVGLAVGIQERGVAEHRQA